MSNINRPISARERMVLERILSMNFHGAVELRRQVPGARVTGQWSEGSPSVYLQVEADRPPAPVSDGLVPVRAVVVGADGEPTGELLLWLDSGKMSALEYAWMTESMPTELPDPDSLQIILT